MTDIVERLRATSLDKDNFPRMKSEKWFPVGLALEAADRIEELEKALGAISCMDQKGIRFPFERGIRADDLGRAARIARAALEERK